jgi:hypothetical protein
MCRVPWHINRYGNICHVWAQQARTHTLAQREQSAFQAWQTLRYKPRTLFCHRVTLLMAELNPQDTEHKIELQAEADFSAAL